MSNDDDYLRRRRRRRRRIRVADEYLFGRVSTDELSRSGPRRTAGHLRSAKASLTLM